MSVVGPRVASGETIYPRCPYPPTMPTDGPTPGPPDWDPPGDWPVVETVESHAGGEPLRVVVDGWPAVEGDTVREKRRYAAANHDHLRTALMLEPRGHADMYGAVPVAPDDADADLGVLFTHNDGFSTMCGHGVIALATVLIETGMVDAADDSRSEREDRTVRMDTPAGRVTARATVEGDQVPEVAFENVPSFVYARDRTVDVPGIGTVPYDVAFGGAFYAYCEAEAADVGLRPEDAEDLLHAGRAIKQAVREDLEIEHPVHDDLGFLYGTIFTGPAEGEGEADSRNVCVFADGEVDRSPTGTGVSGRLALEADAGRLAPGEPFTVESVVGSTFTGRIRDHTTCGEYDAVVPEVAGNAHVTGRSEFVLDPEDPLGEGFLLR